MKYELQSMDLEPDERAINVMECEVREQVHIPEFWDDLVEDIKDSEDFVTICWPGYDYETKGMKHKKNTKPKRKSTRGPYGV